jgi:hypothetical protein
MIKFSNITFFMLGYFHLGNGQCQRLTELACMLDLLKFKIIQHDFMNNNINVPDWKIKQTNSGGLNKTINMIFMKTI